MANRIDRMDRMDDSDRMGTNMPRRKNSWRRESKQSKESETRELGKDERPAQLVQMSPLVAGIYIYTSHDSYGYICCVLYTWPVSVWLGDAERALSKASPCWRFLISSQHGFFCETLGFAGIEVELDTVVWTKYV